MSDFLFLFFLFGTYPLVGAFSVVKVEILVKKCVCLLKKHFANFYPAGDFGL